MNKLPTSGRPTRTKPSPGFSLIEVMFAAVILSVGLMALLAVFAQAVSATRYSREDLVAKQKAREALEGVYAARNDTSIAFSDIQVGAASGQRLASRSNSTSVRNSGSISFNGIILGPSEGARSGS